MKITDVIDKLYAFKQEVGDVDVIVLSECCHGLYVDWDRRLDLIFLPNDKTNEEEGPYAAFVNDDIEEEYKMEPRNHLKLVKEEIQDNEQI